MSNNIRYFPVPIKYVFVPFEIHSIKKFCGSQLLILPCKVIGPGFKPRILITLSDTFETGGMTGGTDIGFEVLNIFYLQLQCSSTMMDFHQVISWTLTDINLFK